jgi:hypothetical protein
MALINAPAVAEGTRVAIAKETTYKVAPTGEANVLPISGESLRLDKRYTDSPTISSNRRSQGQTQTGQGVSGGVNFALRAKAFDEYLGAALWAPNWTSGVAAFPSGTPLDATIAVNLTRFEFFSAGNQLPVFAADDVVSVTDARNWNHVGTYRVATGSTPTAGTFLALKLDGTAPFADAVAQSLRIVKVGEFGSFTLTATVGGTKATIDILDSNGAAAAVAQGWIKLGGFTTNQGNNGIWQVESASTTTLTLVRNDGSSLFVTETDASSWWAIGEYAQDGQTRSSYSIEKRFDLASDVFELHLGCVVDQGTLNFSVGEPISGTFAFQGATMTSPAAAQFSTYIAQPQTTEYGPAQDVRAVLAGGVGVSLRSASFQVANNVRPIEELGVLGASQVVPGTFALTGTLQAYIEDGSLLSRFANGTFTRIDLLAFDSQANGYLIVLPRTKFTEAPANATGKNTDVFAQVAFASEEDLAAGYQARIYRYL